MKLIFIALCAVVALSQVEADNAVDLIKSALSSFPVEKMVEAIEKAATMNYREDQHTLKVVTEFDEWDWKDGQQLALNLFPFDEDVRTQFIAKHSGIMEKIDHLKTTSIRDVLGECPDINEKLTKLFEIIDTPVVSDQEKEVAIKSMIRRVHTLLHQKLETLLDEANEYVEDLQVSRSRRAIDTAEVEEKVTNFWENREQHLSKLRQFIEQYVVWLEQEYMIELSVDVVPEEAKRQAIQKMKHQMNKLVELMAQHDIEQLITDHSDDIKTLASHANKVDTTIKHHLMTLKAKMSEYTFYDIAESLWQGAAVCVNSYQQALLNETNTNTITEADYNAFVQRALLYIGNEALELSEGMHVLLGRIIEKLDIRLNAGKTRETRELETGPDQEDKGPAQQGLDIANKAIHLTTKHFYENLPFQLIADFLRKIQAKGNFTDADVKNMVEGKWEAVTILRADAKLEYEHMVDQSNAKAVTFMELLKTKTPYELAQLLSEKYYDTYLSEKVQNLTGFPETVKTTLRKNSINDITEMLKDKVTDLLRLVVPLIDSRLSEFYKSELASIQADAEGRIEGAELDLGISHERYTEIVEQAIEKAETVEKYIKALKDNDGHLVETFLALGVEHTQEEHNDMIVFDRYTDKIRDRAQNEKTIVIMQPWLTSAREIVEKYREKLPDMDDKEGSKVAISKKVRLMKMQLDYYMDILIEQLMLLAEGQKSNEGSSGSKSSEEDTFFF